MRLAVRRDRVLPGGAAEVQHHLDQRLPHPRGWLDGRAGGRLHARQRDRLRRGGAGAGLEVDQFAPRLSFFFNAHNDFLEEVAKFRAARRLWARTMRERFGAKDPRSWTLRFHAQTAGRRWSRSSRRSTSSDDDPGARGGARRHPDPPHERPRRGARAAFRGHGQAGAENAAGDRLRERRDVDCRSPRRLVRRRVADGSRRGRRCRVHRGDRWMGGALKAIEAGFVQRDRRTPPTAISGRSSVAIGSWSASTASRPNEEPRLNNPFIDDAAAETRARAARGAQDEPRQRRRPAPHASTPCGRPPAAPATRCPHILDCAPARLCDGRGDVRPRSARCGASSRADVCLGSGLWRVSACGVSRFASGASRPTSGGVRACFGVSLHRLRGGARGPAYVRSLCSSTAPMPQIPLAESALAQRLDRLDDRIAHALRRHGVRLLRIAIGLVFVWFGALKLVPGSEPRRGPRQGDRHLRGRRPVLPRPRGLGDPDRAAPPVPADRPRRAVLARAPDAGHVPPVRRPAREVCFAHWPLASPLDLFALTLEGQYIVKNIVLVSAAIVVGGTVRRRSGPEQRL